MQRHHSLILFRSGDLSSSDWYIQQEYTCSSLSGQLLSDKNKEFHDKNVCKKVKWFQDNKFKRSTRRVLSNKRQSITTVYRELSCNILIKTICFREWRILTTKVKRLYFTEKSKLHFSENTNVNIKVIFSIQEVFLKRKKLL